MYSTTDVLPLLIYVAKLDIARIYSRNSNIIVLDEPSSLLNPIAEMYNVQANNYITHNGGVDPAYI